MNYYRITEVARESAFYSDWPNLVGAVVAAIPERVHKSILAPGFQAIRGVFVKLPRQSTPHIRFRLREPVTQRAVKLRRLSPSEGRKIDETRRHAA